MHGHCEIPDVLAHSQIFVALSGACIKNWVQLFRMPDHKQEASCIYVNNVGPWNVIFLGKQYQLVC